MTFLLRVESANYCAMVRYALDDNCQNVENAYLAKTNSNNFFK